MGPLILFMKSGSIPSLIISYYYTFSFCRKGDLEGVYKTIFLVSSFQLLIIFLAADN